MLGLDGLLQTIGLHRKVRRGLALSGGGAKGFAHIGVLLAFERFGIRPDIISGVSAGSIAAALYGAGLSPKEMLECFLEFEKFRDFTEWSVPKSGFFKLDKFGKILEEWLPVKTLDEMRIPTVICATDFDNGKSVGWASGEIVPRVLASCSIPIVFKPIRINGIHYVDGGVLRNLPAWAIRPHCSVLFGSNCSPLNRQYKFKNSLIDIAVRSYQLTTKANTLQDLNICDHIIQTSKMSELKTFDISQMRKTALLGYEAASRVLEKIINV